LRVILVQQQSESLNTLAYMVVQVAIWSLLMPSRGRQIGGAMSASFKFQSRYELRVVTTSPLWSFSGVIWREENGTLYIYSSHLVVLGKTLFNMKLSLILFFNIIGIVSYCQESIETRRERIIRLSKERIEKQDHLEPE